MTIEQIANRIIKDIKGWPEEASQSQDVGGPKTSWDAYKEQIQYEEYDSFEVFEETIESMVRDDISELSDKVITNLFSSIHKRNLAISIADKREDLMNDVFSHIRSEAETQDIEYSKIDIDYVRYNVDDISIVAEILSKVGPEEFIIRGYSEVTGAGGEQGVANISDLADEQGFEFISPDEFDRAKKSLKAQVPTQNETGCISREEARLELKNELNESANQVTDVDGNVYTIITIGNQVWMVENLKTTKFNDRTPIPLEEDEVAWSLLSAPGYCWYNNRLEIYKSVYGALYNLFAIETGKLCPKGWHVPSHLEWYALFNYLGDFSLVGGKLKESCTKPSHWKSPNMGASNESGFAAVPGGYRNWEGIYDFVGDYACLWSSREGDSDYIMSYEMSFNDSGIEMCENFQNDGLSVRCIKD